MKLSTLVRLAVLTAAAAAAAALFVVTYLHFAAVPPRPEPPRREGEDFKEAQLRFPDLDRPGPEEEPLELEWHQDAHRTFLFENPKDQPVRVALEKRNCKCTKVEIGVAPDQSAPLTAEQADADGGLTWAVLDPGGDWFTVPARAAGAVRLTWNGTSLGAQRITAELKTQANAAGVPRSLSVSVRFVRPVFVGLEAEMASPAPPAEADLGEVRADEAGPLTARFVCWSATRDRFGLEAGPTDHPCVSVAAPRRLSDDEVEGLRKTSKKAVRCAYRVEVTVREQTDRADRLNLGPFRHAFTLKSDAVAAEVVTGYVTGVVRGEVTVGGPDDHDRLALGSFPADEDHTGVIDLTADAGTPDLEVESAPKYLRVTLAAGPPTAAVRRWRLKAMFVPNSLVGEFPPEDRVIVLRTRAPKPRRVNVPVTGNAYVK
jgi:hypothetical protein